MARIFISYRHDVEPDQSLARQFYEKYRDQHNVFIDLKIQVGENWAKSIQSEIIAADFLVLLLSKHSVESQMVGEELRMAADNYETNHNPRILPVRVNFKERLPYELGAILNPIQYALWRSSDDTTILFSQLETAIAGGSLPEMQQPKGERLDAEVPLPAADPIAALEAPEGTMPSKSPFYIRRSADKTAESAQALAAFTLTIRGPRQMGKSSLLGRVITNARNRGVQVAFVDFQDMSNKVLQESTLFYTEFCSAIADAFELPFSKNEVWDPMRDELVNCRRYMERHILRAAGEPGLLLVIDEADSLLESPFCSDFFGMLRSWHNRRSNFPEWEKFSLAMAISSEPALLIANLSQSPFNVGTIIEVKDFSVEETREANQKHGSPLSDNDLCTLQGLVGGHPYLMRRALYLVCTGRYKSEDLFSEIDVESGPLGDHLRALLSRLSRRPETLKALKLALSTGQCDIDSRNRLIGGGLVTEQGDKLVARNELYRRYFTRVLNG